MAIAVFALAIAGVLALLWLGSRSDADTALTQRDNAVVERDAAIAATIDADTALRASQDELADALTALEDASGSDARSGASDTDELQDLRDEVDELTAEVERLEAENETLAIDLADLEASATTTPSTTTTLLPTPTVPPSVSPDDIGEQVGGLFRSSVLGDGQQSCLGQALLDVLGAQRVLEAIAAASPGDDEQFVDAIRSAASICNIDPSAIFG